MLYMIAFRISRYDVKRIQVWKPRNKDVGFLLHPKFLCFQKHAFLHILLNCFKTNYRFVIHEVQPSVQPFKMVLNFKSLLKKIKTNWCKTCFDEYISHTRMESAKRRHYKWVLMGYIVSYFPFIFDVIHTKTTGSIQDTFSSRGLDREVGFRTPLSTEALNHFNKQSFRLYSHRKELKS